MDPFQQQQPVQQSSVPTPPPVPANAQQVQQPQPTSILERLRQQVARELMPDPVEEMQRRARTWAAGIGATRGSLFEGLAAGQQAVENQRQREEQARAGRLQQMEQEAQRQAELNLRQAEFEYNRDPTNPTNQLRLAQARQALNEVAQGRRPTVREFLDDQGRVVLVNVETGQEIRRTGLRPTQELRMQPRPLSEADRARIRQRADADALREIPAVADTPEIIAQRRRRADELFEAALLAAAAAGATPAVQGAPAGQPAQPARTLQYPRAPQQQ